MREEGNGDLAKLLASTSLVEVLKLAIARADLVDDYLGEVLPFEVRSVATTRPGRG